MLCGIYAYLFYSIMGCIVFLQATLALNRWAVVCKRHWLSLKRTYLSVVCSCLAPCALLLLPASGLWGSLGWDPDTQTCTILAPGGESVGVFLRLLGPCLPYSIIILCYALIIRHLKASRKRITRTECEVSQALPSIKVPCTPPSPRFQKGLQGSASIPCVKASSNQPPDTSPASRNLFSKPEYGSDSNSELVSSIPMAGLKLGSPIGTVQRRLPTGSSHSSNSLPEESKPLQRPNTLQLYVPLAVATSCPILGDADSYVAALKRRQSVRLKRRRKKEQGMTLTVVMILASYICCNLPAMIITMVDPNGQKMPEAHLPILTLLWLSGVVNPIVYVVFNPMYRKVFRERFRRTCLRVKKSVL